MSQLVLSSKLYLIWIVHQGAMMLYTSEDQVLKDKVSATLHSPVPPNDIKPSELDNLQKHILQFGTSAVINFHFIRIWDNDTYRKEDTYS